MFENLTNRLSHTFRALKNQHRFTENNVKKALDDIRRSLLEADVALPVITEFLAAIKEKALGQAVSDSLKPEQALVKIVKEELIHILGSERAELDFKSQPPAVIMLAGLQGAGKTTTVAKLARYLKDSENKKVIVTSLDVYRPAAIEQLRILAEQIDVSFYRDETDQNPLSLAKKALDYAKKQYVDVVLFDTAGRLHIDDLMMNELKTLHNILKPIETLFVVDSMTGQDAANTAKIFHETLPLTGIILTKTDGDARGGAALSVKQITGQPIKFIGAGEKVDALEPFYPERIASRILGMGDLLSLIEDVERKTGKETKKLAKKIKGGSKFDLNDFKKQLEQMGNMGGISSLLKKLPGMAQLSAKAMQHAPDERTITQTIAMINSMTPQERAFPKLIKGSRKIRITRGSGTQMQDLNGLLKKFEKMQKMMGKLGKPGSLQQMMRGMPGLPGLSNMFPDD